MRETTVDDECLKNLVEAVDRKTNTYTWKHIGSYIYKLSRAIPVVHSVYFTDHQNHNG